MVRPKMCRRVRCGPRSDIFKPQGIKSSEIEKIDLHMEEFEAIRLKDHQRLDQIASAEKMKVSQSTFHRIYSEARQKIAKALVEGLAIQIHGGAYKMPGCDKTGPEGKGPMTGRGHGKCGEHGCKGRRWAGGVEPTKEEMRSLLEEQKKKIEKKLADLG
ncbi:MAG: DUF134 domain-containing protein [Candidatus Woesearchaeota archaeon]